MMTAVYAEYSRNRIQGAFRGALVKRIQHVEQIGQQQSKTFPFGNSAIYDTGRIFNPQETSKLTVPKFASIVRLMASGSFSRRIGGDAVQFQL